ncbi:MAG: C39 family peptidase [Burkholderiales bacterium]|nr:C39 family peptidase [Burkholderiales bacterium]MBK9347688.1 C39 family peptidase [Burkholderiales bacterium]MBP8053759.1 C39 family peptidase [Burkholderiaceae bacterium]
MWSIILLTLGISVGGMVTTTIKPPIDMPEQQFRLPMGQVSPNVVSQPVTIKPQSVLKFKNIVHQAYDYSCGSAALVTVVNSYLGIDISERDAMEGMMAHGEREKIVARRGFSLLDMKRYLATLGAEGNGFRADMNDLRELKVPAVVPIDYAGFKHFVVFRGIRDGKVFIADPAMGHIVFAEAEFAELWDKNTLFLIKPPKGQETIGKLALSTRELGVVDVDLIRSDAVFPQMDRVDNLQRAIQSNFGTFSLRK